MQFDSPSVAMYGPGSVGKSVAAIRAFPPDRIFYCSLERGSFAPLSNPDMNPWRNAADTVLLPSAEFCASCLDAKRPYEELLDVAENRIAPAIEKGRVAGVILDTGSAWTERYFDRLMGGSTQDGYGKKAGLVGRRWREITNVLLSTGGIVIAIFHERPYSDFEGRIRLGGPKFVQKEEDTAGLIATYDTVLRARIGPHPLQPTLLVRQFQCDPMDREFLGRMRDRWNVCRAIEPLDLRIIVKRAAAQAAGQPLPPPAEFPPPPAGPAAGALAM